MAEVNLDEVNKYSNADSRRFDSNTFANPVVSGQKETLDNKGSSGNKINTPVYMSYPIARDEKNSNAEYLEILIEKYTPPGLSNESFKNFGGFDEEIPEGGKARAFGDKILS